VCVFFLALAAGQATGLSVTQLFAGEQEGSADAVENMDNVAEPAEPDLPEPPTEPEVEMPPEYPQGLAYEDVLALIKEPNKKMTENPDAILALVNKNNNLAADYVPVGMVEPAVPFSFQNADEKRLMRPEAAQALEELFAAATEAGHQLAAVSGFRSYGRQKSIFLNNVQKSGFERANFFSALPGQSEHQTGLAMDVSSAAVGYKLVTNFGETPEGSWLNDNAHIFGFIIRYPQDKTDLTGYQYEPWHLRFVGVDAAAEINARGWVLEEYLADLNQT
jgi:D-alanyl-D-alanine carboxypeptidase